MEVQYGSGSLDVVNPFAINPNSERVGYTRLVLKEWIKEQQAMHCWALDPVPLTLEYCLASKYIISFSLKFYCFACSYWSIRQ